MDVVELPYSSVKFAERDLVRRILDGAAIAFREFVERYQSQVYRVAYGIIGRRDYADEVAQQVFVKAYFSIKSFDSRGSLYAWVYRMAVNESYGFLRNKRPDVFSDSADGHTAVGGISRRDFVNKLLNSIPEEDRYLLFLRELEGHSVAHLTETTGLNENTIKLKLLRTRQALAKVGAHC
jgi:RNA polymerase sigma-70 factor, ECF subfamily